MNIGPFPTAPKPFTFEFDIDITVLGILLDASIPRLLLLTKIRLSTNSSQEISLLQSTKYVSTTIVKTTSETPLQNCRCSYPSGQHN